LRVGGSRVVGLCSSLQGGLAGRAPRPPGPADWCRSQSGEGRRMSAPGLGGSGRPARTSWTTAPVFPTCVSVRWVEGTSRQVGLGAEKRVGATVRVCFSVAWLPPGHDPGPGGGATTTARQRDLGSRWDIYLVLGHFGTKTRPQGRARHHEQRRDRQPSERGESCRTERSQLRSRKRAFRERARSAGQADGARAVGPGTAWETTCH
jgi:hypothetical protein